MTKKGTGIIISWLIPHSTNPHQSFKFGSKHASMFYCWAHVAVQNYINWYIS